jgi:hypothetical protein
MRNIKPTQEVWFVSGCEEGYLFETKRDAEIHAKNIFPDESEPTRYARSISKPFMNLRKGCEMKTALIGDNELSRKDLEAVSEMVHDALRDMGINPASFAWHIEVEYTEEEEVK